MDPRRKILPALLMCSAAVLAAGCSSSLVNREGFDAAGRIAVVSVVLPRVDGVSREGNRSVLAAAADHAAAQVRAGLASAGRAVPEPAKGREARALQAYGKVSDGDLAVLHPEAGERAKVRELVQGDVAAWNDRFVGAQGLAVIPREALAPDEERTQKDPAVRAVMLQQAGALCTTLQVDAVAFAHLRLSITHPRSAFIVTDGRTDGIMSMSATLVVVDRSGRIIADMGVRPLDKGSRKRDLLPLYRGAGRDAVKDENVDLADPRKKVPQALAALIDESVADLMSELQAARGK